MATKKKDPTMIPSDDVELQVPTVEETAEAEHEELPAAPVRKKRATAKKAQEDAVMPQPDEPEPAPEPEKPTVKKEPAQPPNRKTPPRPVYATPEEESEWNAIFASLRSRSILTGAVLGVDKNTFEMTDRESGGTEIRTVHSVVLIAHRVKVIIPETEMWMPGEERPPHVLRNMVGSKIDYVILEVDEETSCAIASRRIAMSIRRRYFRTAPRGHALGQEVVTANILAVGPNRCLVEYSGFDVSLKPSQLSYSAIADLRERYHSGDELRCVLLDFDAEQGSITLSARLATTNPFDGAEQRHPIGSRRQAAITGKYNGGVFVTLPDGVTCLCKYSQVLSDQNFSIGDNVIVVIDRYNNERKLISGRILRRW